MTTSHPYYLDFLSAELLAETAQSAESIPGVEGLTVSSALRTQYPDVLTDQALSFLARVYRASAARLDRLHAQRRLDRAFIDAHTLEYVGPNQDLDFTSPEYGTVIGDKDDEGRVVIGPASIEPDALPIEIPAFLAGDQVTLFGPPDTAKMSINAMNAVHRVPKGEHPMVTALVDSCGVVARWGADSEDSKTPILASLLAAIRNLKGCHDRSLAFDDPKSGKAYRLAADRLSIPIKRIPGLAIPEAHIQLDGVPLPLHIIDFALHLFHNHQNPEALVFYVPKLEGEEESAYLKAMIGEAESAVKVLHPSYTHGSVKLFIVFENPRSIFRIREMANALHPHFVGGSLGWHDFLGSTARVFRHDPRYRIPVKADPNIVINHIKQSHQILVDAVHPGGGLAIGGMYGVLYEDGNPSSFEVSIVGFIKDVSVQLKRGLDGFWVAHPDFVRVGLALVHAWRLREADASDTTLHELVEALVPDPAEREPLEAFVFGDDVDGLDPSDSLYPRAVLAATLEESDVIPNNHPDEVRYNVFQALQYLADWLSGNGCVALPAAMTNQAGEQVFVRIMDDLATTERSRWELWAEVNHGRFSVADFDQMLNEELAFIKAGINTPDHRVQVRWDGAARWYPIAARLLRQLVVSPDPVEFATELLLPFACPVIRDAPDPWEAATRLCPQKYT